MAVLGRPGGTVGYPDGGVTQGGKKLASTVYVPVILLAASTHGWAFIADRPYKVVLLNEAHSVVGGAAAAVKFRKITDTSAPNASAGATVKELQTAAFDLTAVINTTQTAALSSTPSDLLLVAGDKIGYMVSGTLTGLVGSAFLGLQPV